jgi:hypothetical protein
MSTGPGQATALRQLFDDGEIYAVSDCEWLTVAAAHYGLTGISLGEAPAAVPAEASIVLFMRRNLVDARVRKLFPRAAVLVVPIASFDPDLESALYTQRLVSLTDYAAACAQSRYWADSLTNEAGPLIFSASSDASGKESPRTELACTFADNLNAAAWLEPAIRPGQWVSVGSLCELSLSIQASSERPYPFSLDGTAVASGVLVARDRRFSEDGGRRIRQAEKLRCDLTAAGPVTLRLEDGVLAEARAGGRDFTDAIAEATNPAHGLRALELGIGTNQSVLPAVDWAYNSQLNEGAGSFHIGFGEGMTGAHMDFIVAESSHHFATPN